MVHTVYWKTFVRTNAGVVGEVVGVSSRWEIHRECGLLREFDSEGRVGSVVASRGRIVNLVTVDAPIAVRVMGDGNNLQGSRTVGPERYGNRTRNEVAQYCPEQLPFLTEQN